MVIHRVDDVDKIVITPVVEIQTTQITQVIAAEAYIPGADTDPDVGP